ncbi:MAG: hypothetical protein Q4G08_11445 [Capnocytophaga sp.]|nr:hypothetical protein [Capnocytophaga sp.]
MKQLFNKIVDTFTSADFEVKSTMKVTELTKHFKANFGLSLRVYKGKQIASDGRMTLKTLDKRVTQTAVNFDSDKMKIRATQTVGEVEQMFLDNLGIVVQIADLENKKLINNALTLGDARRAKA